MRMMVLAGGFGTRLREAVPGVPKPLAPVGSQPFLYFQLEHWIAQGVRSFIFLLHHQSDLIVRFLDDQKSGLLSSCDVRWVREPSPMDTGGAVAYGVRSLDMTGEFLVTNADTWIGSGVDALCAARASAMGVVSKPDAGRFGQVEFDPSGHVTRFLEKEADAGTGWINAGMYVLNCADLIDWDEKPFSLERHFFPNLALKHGLRVVTLETDFIDIGVPDDYARFCRWQSAGRRGGLCY